MQHVRTGRQTRRRPQGTHTPVLDPALTLLCIAGAVPRRPQAANVALDVYGAILTKQHGRALSTWGINAVRFGSAAIGTRRGRSVGMGGEGGEGRDGKEGTEGLEGLRGRG